MKLIFLLVFIVAVISSCSDDDIRTEDIAYIKILISDDAKKATAYNKGLGAFCYAYFDLNRDSVFYLYPNFFKKDEVLDYAHKAYEGKLNNKKYQDTIFQLIQALDWRPVGSVTAEKRKGNTYCGWSFSVQYKKGNTIRYYDVIATESDTLDRFYEFLRRFEQYSWSKKAVESQRVNLDEEVVSYAKLTGEYEAREIPYLFPECGSGINFKNLVGRWRLLNGKFTPKENFLCYIFQKGQTFSIGRYINGKYTEKVKGTYSVNSTDRKIVFVNMQGQKMTQSITLLTDSCFEGVNITSDRSSVVKFNRF